jgi:hypothetical protein
MRLEKRALEYHRGSAVEGKARRIEVKKMAAKRYVDGLVSVFNLRIGEALGLPQRLSTRIMYSYDRQENRRSFTILNNNLSDEMSDKLKSWLEKNVFTEVIGDLKSNELDGDQMAQCVGA